MARYFIYGREVEIPEDPPPCMWCGALIPEDMRSMDGPLVCGYCDMGRNPDGGKWTRAEQAIRKQHATEYFNKYSVELLN